MALREDPIFYTLFFDGCSKGNPGRAGAGAVLYKNQVEVYADSLFVGEKETNNVAEYNGLLLGLREAVSRGVKKLAVKGDSLLIIKQLNGEYKVNSPAMKPLYEEAKALSSFFDRVTFEHVYRTDNKRADALANMGIE
jgi:ribonuclease HI